MQGSWEHNANNRQQSVGGVTGPPWTGSTPLVLLAQPLPLESGVLLEDPSST